MAGVSVEGQAESSLQPRDWGGVRSSGLVQAGKTKQNLAIDGCEASRLADNRARVNCLLITRTPTSPLSHL